MDESHPHPPSVTGAEEGTTLPRPEANLSIFDAAPVLTIFPTSMASAISCPSAPFSRAFAKLTSRHGWQFAVIEAPTAINLIVRSSSFMVHPLLSNLIDEGQSGKDTLSIDPPGIS
jgi:hypothetical protein